MNIARTIHDAYRNCEAPVRPAATNAGRAAGGTAPSTSTSSQVPRFSGVGQRLGSLSSIGSARTSRTSQNPRSIASVTPMTPAAVAAAQRRRFSYSTTPTGNLPIVVVGGGSAGISSSTASAAAPPRRTIGSSIAPHDRAARQNAHIYLATINHLPSPSVARRSTFGTATTTTTPLSANPTHFQGSQPRFSSGVAAALTPTTTRTASTTPRSSSGSSSAPTRNVGSLFMRTMITLKTSVYKWQPSGGASGAGDDNNECTCAICLDEFTPGCYVRKLPCAHFFHKACVDTWLTVNTNCPACRRKCT